MDAKFPPVDRPSIHALRPSHTGKRPVCTDPVKDKRLPKNPNLGSNYRLTNRRSTGKTQKLCATRNIRWISERNRIGRQAVTTGHSEMAGAKLSRWLRWLK